MLRTGIFTAALLFPLLSGLRPASRQTADVEARGGGIVFNGQVVDQDGKAVKGATVHLLPVDLTQSMILLPAKTLQTTSNEQGTYVFHNLRTGVYKVWAERESQTSLGQSLRGTAIFLNEPNKEYSPLTIKLQPGGTLRFNVLDAKTGRPIQNATIKSTLDIFREEKTDTNGFAKLSGLPAGVWRVNIATDSYATEYVEATEKEAGFDRTFTIEMHPEAKVQGTVSDESGEGIANAEIYEARRIQSRFQWSSMR